MDTVDLGITGHIITFAEDAECRQCIGEKEKEEHIFCKYPVSSGFSNSSLKD